MRQLAHLAIAALMASGCQAPTRLAGPELKVSGTPEGLQAFEKAARACGMTHITRGTTEGSAWLSAKASGRDRAYDCSMQWLMSHPETFGATGAGEPVRPVITSSDDS
ncbi:hypothetical protein [Brevundimonas sp. FT23028]|uniref:hypothetical protein n=1 Tax=Brevundimonas sp. FT23028 TaxID=3393748 RepID=UPI003B58ABC6